MAMLLVASLPLATAASADDEARLVLRIDTPEYLFPFDRIGVETPPFSAYSDGRIIYRDGGFFEIQLSPEQLTELLAQAASNGGLAQAASSYDGQISDDGTTSFLIDTDELSRTIHAYAFGTPVEYLREVTSEEAKAYDGMLALYDWLVTTDGFIPQDAEPSPYEPVAYTAYMFSRERLEDPANANWPWPELGIDDLAAAGVSGFAPLWSLRLTAEQAGRLDGERFIVDDVGRAFDLTLSPLLPDEVASQE